MRIDIHVRPGARRPAVGGARDGALLVAVTQRPEGGRATTAALAAVADALRLPIRAVTLAHGSTNRRKVVEVDVPESAEAAVAARLRDLLDGRPG